MFLQDNSGRTAIARTSMSAPTKWLLNNDKLHGRIIDYGCGRGKDVEILSKKGYDISGYDKNHNPDHQLIQQQSYDIIICNYVFNVIGYKERKVILNNWKEILADDGVAYVAVRRDIPKGSTKTFKDVTQYYVTLPYKTIYVRKNSFIIYMITKDDIR